jgi:hypothetical protein
MENAHVVRHESYVGNRGGAACCRLAWSAASAGFACAFVEHALRLPVRRVAMLLPIDFDSAISRQHLFRFCPAFTGKCVLLNRIRWIPGSTGSPSTNHAWCLWDKDNKDAPTVRYVSRREVEL